VVDEDTIGLHPWHLDSALNIKKAHKFCRMIGETGLDRSEKYKDCLSLQEKMLHVHFDVARICRLPIVLHCVRAHSDLLGILKELRYDGKILLHDFSGNIQQMNDYLNYDVYFSFRRKFEILKVAPQDRIFLETDDQLQLSLQDIYRAAGVNETQIENNFLCIFGDSQNVRSADVIHNFRLAGISNQLSNFIL
jgi:TatD DNase family protein